MLSILLLLAGLGCASAMTGTMDDMEHVVIFMQENRAFDHYYGVMPGVRGFNDRAAPPLPDGGSPFHQPLTPPPSPQTALCGCGVCDFKWSHPHSQMEAFLLHTRCDSLKMELGTAQPPVDVKKGMTCMDLITELRKSTYEHENIGAALSGGSTCPSGAHVTDTVTPESPTEYMLPFPLHFKNTSATCMPAPEMGYPSDINIWNNGSMNAWNTARYPGYGMAFFNKTDLPYYYELAAAFTIGDQYFQSTFTATNPNRLHLFTGSNGLSVNGSGINVVDDDTSVLGWKWETMGETLEKGGISWRVYQQEDNFNDNAFAWFTKYKFAKHDSPLWKKGMYRSANVVAEFESDIKAGTLPQVSWIVGPTDYSEHATHHPQAGEGLSAELIAVLQKYPEMYKKTAFILNYDEGGQFFDHHWTPTVPVSEADGKSTVSTIGEVTLIERPAHGVKPGQPIGLGFRVPLMIVSPWTRGGYVFSQVSDHTSVLQLVEKRFNVRCPNISPWRRAVCSDLLAAFDFSNPDYSWPTFPNTTNYAAESNYQCEHNPPPEVPITQHMPSQNPGTRKSRALPYTFTVTAKGVNEGKVQLTISNTGKAGAAFYVYNLLKLSQQHPRKFTVEAGKTLVDEWVWGGGSNGAYSLSLHGPNGYVRQMKSTGDSTEHTIMSYDIKRDEVIVSLSSPRCEFTVTDNAYQTGGPWELPQGGSHTHSVASSGNWYDLSVTSALCGLTERFMGRLENPEHATITDPAMSTLPVKEANVRATQNAEGHPTLPHHIVAAKWTPQRECKTARSWWKDACSAFGHPAKDEL